MPLFGSYGLYFTDSDEEYTPRSSTCGEGIEDMAERDLCRGSLNPKWDVDGTDEEYEVAMPLGESNRSLAEKERKRHHIKIEGIL